LVYQLSKVQDGAQTEQLISQCSQFIKSSGNLQDIQSRLQNYLANLLSKRSMNIDKNQNRISDNISNFMEHSLISEEMGTLNSSVENSPRKDGNGNGRGVN
tara:strand:+ start:242 stop:544 length:303 start_codon:yes stop_codon:yes gene_type:complete